MTKSEMVDGIAKSGDITKKAAAAALEALTETITKDLKKGNNVVITGFGTFRISKRAARTGVNPRNPSEKIKAMKVPLPQPGQAPGLIPSPPACDLPTGPTNRAPALPRYPGALPGGRGPWTAHLL